MLFEVVLVLACILEVLWPLYIIGIIVLVPLAFMGLVNPWIPGTLAITFFGVCFIALIFVAISKHIYAPDEEVEPRTTLGSIGLNIIMKNEK